MAATARTNAVDRQPALSMYCDTTGERCQINTSGYNCAVVGPSILSMYEFPEGRAPETAVRCAQAAIDLITGAAHDRGFELGIEQGHIEAAQGGVK